MDLQRISGENTTFTCCQAECGGLFCKTENEIRIKLKLSADFYQSCAAITITTQCAQRNVLSNGISETKRVRTMFKCWTFLYLTFFPYYNIGLLNKNHNQSFSNMAIKFYLLKLQSKYFQIVYILLRLF